MNLICPFCNENMELAPYHDMYIAECANCGYDDKDLKDLLIARYRKRLIVTGLIDKPHPLFKTGPYTHTYEW